MSRRMDELTTGSNQAVSEVLCAPYRSRPFFAGSVTRVYVAKRRGGLMEEANLHVLYADDILARAKKTRCVIILLTSQHHELKQ
jgi:hypothetical protein